MKTSIVITSKPKQPLQEQWLPDNSVFEQLRPIIEARAGEQDVEDHGIEASRILPNGPAKRFEESKQSVDALHFRSVEPHTDLDFPKWFAIWVVNGQKRALHSASMTDAQLKKLPGDPYRKKGQRYGILKDKTDVASPLDNGTFILFNAHRVHWVPPIPGKGVSGGDACLVMVKDYSKRPTRNEVEQSFLKDLKPFMPLIKTAVPVATAKRRRP